MKERILIIEDDEIIRETLEDLFSLHGYRVFGEPNGLKGISLAKGLKPDLIICDIMMPEMNGFETLQAIQRIEKLADVPFIFLTAKVEPKDFRDGMNLGASDYVTKPFSNNELLKVVKLRLKKCKRMKMTQNVQIVKLKQMIKDQNERINSYALLNSHELRGPVARILGLMDLLMKDQIKAEQSGNIMIIKMLKETCSELDSIVLEINEILSHEKLGNSLNHT